MINSVNTGRPVAKEPCNECPFRRNSVPGWLGGASVEEYIRGAHNEANTPCHVGPGFRSGDPARMRPCSGMAHFRNAVCKTPRSGPAADAVMAVGTSPDVFSSDAEFRAHHDTPEHRRMYGNEMAQAIRHVMRGGM